MGDVADAVARDDEATCCCIGVVVGVGLIGGVGTFPDVVLDQQEVPGMMQLAFYSFLLPFGDDEDPLMLLFMILMRAQT